MTFKNKLKKNIHNWGATVAGIIVAIATAWSTVEWSTFDWKRDYMKLVLSAIIAIGGYISTFKKPELPKEDEPNQG